MGKCKSYYQSVQCLRENELMALMSLLSLRDFPEPVRGALMLRYHHGYSLSQAAVKTSTTRQAVSRAEKKILMMHDVITAVYVTQSTSLDCE